MVLTFGNEGALYGNAMTWWDHETESLWSQPLGEALVGELKGERLELYASSLTTWAAWRQSHPQTLALETGSQVRASGFSLDSMMIAVEIGSQARAVRVTDLREAHVINTVVEGVPVAFVILGDEWAVFHRVVDGVEIDIEINDGELFDTASSRSWHPSLGFRSDGDEGDQLARIPAFTVFPRDFSTFWPSGSVWSSADQR